MTASNDQKSECEEGPVDFERAILLTGNGKFNYLVLLTLLPVCWANFYASTSISYVLPSAECELKLSMLDKGLLNSMSFAGMIITSFVWGFIVDAFGRRKIMVYGYLCTAICTLATSFSPASWQLILFKFVDGIVISGPYVALQSYMAEIHSEHLRSQMYMWMGMFFALGNISLSCLAWLIIPHKWQWSIIDGWIELTSWRLFLAFCTIPGLLASFALYFLPESPRFLIAKKRHDDALGVFKKIYAINTGKNPDTYPVKYLEEEESIKISGISFKQTLIGSLKQIQPIFLPPNAVTLVLTAFIQCGATIGSNTLRLWMPMLFSMIETYDHLHADGPTTSMCNKIDEVIFKNVTVMQNETSGDIPECTENVVNATVYINSIVISVASFIGYLIAKNLVNKISKKILMVVCFIGASACCGILYWAEDSNGILAISSVFVALSSIGGTIVNNVVVDTFPTALRTMALSVTMVVGRMGAVVGNLLFPVLFTLDCLGPFIMIGSVCLMCATLVLVLPREKL
ncbi:PREDICTED: synaptic vesicle glycoprotein 2B-like isoform X2 [Ceratosolen solmsi marchali]|uniref:Synaptic vesicle glycoprotein 2B-like isoform X2 n=1 Tax=Ceratosolen solmsi marchali TaxID=326594 RepID=A0AAJ6YMJ1_9HYME|nr:PREDICTED: synaptic vesicle glycoprotein 2B-like isoform X2 [Ceratosolen solmsi marchali]